MKVYNVFCLNFLDGPYYVWSIYAKNSSDAINKTRQIGDYVYLARRDFFGIKRLIRPINIDELSF